MKAWVTLICFCALVFNGETKDETLKIGTGLTIDISGSEQMLLRSVLPPRSITPIRASNIPPEARYLVFQAHTQTAVVSLSYTEQSPPPFSDSDTSTNAGLVVLLDALSVDATTYVHNLGQANVTALLVVMVHGPDDPVPGGCNMEFPVEVSPFLRLSLGPVDAVLEFQHASLGSSRESPLPTCGSDVLSFQYDLYLAYLNQWDFSADHYFTAISQMLSPSSMRSSAHAVRVYGNHPKTRALFLTYPGEGAIYNVVVRQKTKDGKVREVAYVPVATYGCLWFSQLEVCRGHENAWTLIAVLLLDIVGLIICFRGHRLFSFQMFFFGYLAFAFISFMLFAKTTRLSQDGGILVAVLGGLAGAVLWLFLWYFLAIPALSMILPGLLLGSLLSAILLFTPIGEASFLQNIYSYWVFFGSIMLLPTILLLPQGKLLSILSCSFVGSYCGILVPDMYLGTSLSYVVLNVVRRSLLPGGYQASNEVPFQANDVILSVAWGALCILGAGLQLWTERGRAPFPQSPYYKWLRERTSAGQPLLQNGTLPPPYYGSVASAPPPPPPPREPPPRYGTL